MKKVLGNVNIYDGDTHCLRIYFNRKLVDILGEEIVFNEREMIITKPGIDSKVTLSLRHKVCSFSPKLHDKDHYVGTYALIQKDEDTFKLKKTSNEVHRARRLGNRV